MMVVENFGKGVQNFAFDTDKVILILCQATALMNCALIKYSQVFRRSFQEI